MKDTDVIEPFLKTNKFGYAEGLSVLEIIRKFL